LRFFFFTGTPKLQLRNRAFSRRKHWKKKTSGQKVKAFSKYRRAFHAYMASKHSLCMLRLESANSKSELPGLKKSIFFLRR